MLVMFILGTSPFLSVVTKPNIPISNIKVDAFDPGVKVKMTSRHSTPVLSISETLRTKELMSHPRIPFSGTISQVWGF